MTKTTVKFAAIAALVAGLGLVSATTASAATFGTTANSGSTTAKTTLKASDTGTGDNGVVLKSAPDIHFGTIQLNGDAVTSTADNTNVTDTLTVVNAGHKDGWNVQVQNDAMVSGSDTLTGATITLPTVTPSNGVAGDTSVGATTKVELPGAGSQGATNVMTAPAKGGVGTWNADYSSTKPTLSVPANSVEGAYTSNLTWSLVDSVKA